MSESSQPTEEVYRDDELLVQKHGDATDCLVSVRIGRPPEEASPIAVDARDLRDVLDEFLSRADAKPLDVTCPTCKFVAGKECRVLVDEGAIERIREPHQARIDLAEEEIQ